MLQGTLDGKIYTYVDEKIEETKFITPNQILPIFDLQGKIISLKYSENGQNSLPIYILFSSLTGFDNSKLNNRNFVLTRMIKVNWKFICENGYFIQSYIDNQKSIIFIHFKNRNIFLKEYRNLEIIKGNIITKVFLVAAYQFAELQMPNFGFSDSNSFSS